MQLEQVFDKITKNLINAIIDYTQNKITIEQVVFACQIVIDYLKFYDKFIDL